MSQTLQKTISRLVLISSLTLAATGISQALDVTKNRDFLKFDSDAQSNFIHRSIVTVSAVMTQVRESQSKCISDWYTQNPETNKKRQADVLEIVKKFPDHRPIAAVLFILQQQCGKFRA